MTFPWLEEMQPGSFAGVDVRFPKMTVERGRKVVLTEIPGGNKGHFRDQGKHVRKWPLEFYVIGDNYHVRMRELEDKLDEQLGPWPLVDPWRGESTVEIISSVVVETSTAQGGMAIFRFQVALADPLEFPVLAEPAAAVNTAIPPATLTVRDQFESEFTFGKLQAIVRSALGLCTTNMRVVNGKIASALSTYDDVSSQVDAWESLASATNTTPSALFESLTSVWDGARDLFLELLSGPDVSLPTSDAGGRDSGYHEPAALIGEAFADVAGLDLGAEDMNADIAATVDGKLAKAAILNAEFAYKAVAFNALLAALVEIEIPSLEQAEALKDDIAGYLLALSDYDVDGATQESLADVRAAAVDWLVTQGTKAPRTTTIQIARPVPATVLAKRIYGDSRRANELLRRNAVHVPLRVSGTLEVDRG